MQVGTLSNDPHTDARDTDLLDTLRVENQKISSGVVLDYDAAGHVVGIAIDYASQQVASQK